MYVNISEEAIFKFYINDIVKIGKSFFKILNKSELRHEGTSGAIATTVKSTVDYNTNMMPREGYLYFISHIGIDGLCEWRFEYPKGIGHFSPQGNEEYFDYDMGNKLDPMYIPFIIQKPDFVTIKWYNPSGITNNSDIYFFGEKWRVEPITYDVPEGQYKEIEDYPHTDMGSA